ncbi:hypothetical protein ALC62_06176 [Cyphomyrmex costatus]|uniref:Uncharacterized protein n=1 Tax=Cyphomyrmex costatus TaxID=456900 RepID=A0A195CQV3_9HYME|nr:hypothetical protein ALC62_06176 [Cyphomyrmex costatus]
MWTNLTKDQPCVTKISECSSHECQKEIRNISVLGVNHQIIHKKGFMCLEEALHHNFQIKNVKCQRSECPGRRTEYAKFNLHLYIELDIRVSLDANTGISCQLKDFPITINILKQEYRLAGVIAYTSQHYIAYTRRIYGTWRIYNDLMKSKQYCNEEKKIEPHAAIYIISSS